MKIIVRAVAAVMLIAVVAAMFAACGKDKKKQEAETVYYDDARIVDKWVCDDEGDDTTWTFYDDDTFTVTGGPQKADIKGTYHILREDGVKLEINVEGEEKSREFSYVPTDTSIMINGFDFLGEDNYSFHGKKAE